MKRLKIKQTLGLAFAFGIIVVFFQNCGPGFQYQQNLASSDFSSSQGIGDIVLNIKEAQTLAGSYATFEVSSTTPAPVDLTIRIVTEDQTAKAGTHFVAIDPAKVWTLAKGEMLLKVSIPTLNYRNPDDSVFNALFNITYADKNATLSSSAKILSRDKNITLPKFVKLVATRNRTCGLTPEFKILCWGKDSVNGWQSKMKARPSAQPTELLTKLPVKDIGRINTGSSSALAITYDDNTIEYSDGPNSITPTPADRVVPGVASANSGSSVCELNQDMNASCTGYNYLGQFGNNSKYGSNYWVDRPEYKDVIELASASDFPADCFIKSNASLDCANTIDTAIQLSDDFRVFSSTFKKVYGGVNNACGLTSDGTIYCWGTATYRQPLAIPAIKFKQAFITNRGLAISESDQVYTIFANVSGEGQTPPSATLTTLFDGLSGRIQEIVSPNCVLTDEAQIYCAYGSAPAADLDPGTKYLSVAVVGRDSICGLTTVQKIKCYSNSTVDRIISGNLTIPSKAWVTLNSSYTFKKLKGFDHFTDPYFCGLTNNEQLVCWGEVPNLANLPVASTEPFIFDAPGVLDFWVSYRYLAYKTDFGTFRAMGNFETRTASPVMVNIQN